MTASPGGPSGQGADTAPRAATADTAAPQPNGRQRARRTGLLLLALAVVLVGLGYLVWKLWLSPPTETTDDAYVAGDVVAITARDSGTVTAILADDTQRVRAGQALVDLDPATADVDLAAAAARLGQAVRSVRGDTSQVHTALASVRASEIALARAEADLKRRRQAVVSGAISAEEAAHAADAVKSAAAAVDVARNQLTVARTRVEGSSIVTNPAVQAAIAEYRRAAIRRSHMHLVSPIDGTIAKRSVQVGQQVGAGMPLMAVVPLDQLWIDANFRETQLADLRVGQPVTITTDIYGDKVTFHGKVEGLGAGSGNAFALLPPQNATGNWIKVVQRVPVRIALDRAELASHPLRIGLSTTVTVDTADRSGSPLGTMASRPIATQPSLSPDVEGEIRAIIAANAGSAGNLGNRP